MYMKRVKYLITLVTEVLERFNYKPNELLNKVINRSFIELWEYEAHRAEALYEEALEDFHIFDKDSLLSMIIAVYLYREILNSIRKKGYDCLSCRSFVSRPRKYILLAKSYLDLKKFKTLKTYYIKKSSGISH